LGNAAESAREGVKSAGADLGDAASKAKVPAIAVGTGVVGFCGGLAVGRRRSRTSVLGIPMPTKRGTEAVSKNLADAAKHVGGFGEGMGSLAIEIRRVREGLGAAGVEKHRSPIEIVLQALTRRP
jgi:hypothetical protein